MRTVTVAEEADALQQAAGRHSASYEYDLLAGSEIFGAVDFARIGDSHARHALLLLRISGHQASHHLAMQTAQRSGRDDALGRPTDSHYSVDTSASHSGRNAGRKIAVPDQANARSSLADIGNQFFVTRPVQHD